MENTVLTHLLLEANTRDILERAQLEHQVAKVLASRSPASASRVSGLRVRVSALRTYLGQWQRLLENFKRVRAIYE